MLARLSFILLVAASAPRPLEGQSSPAVPPAAPDTVISRAETSLESFLSLAIASRVPHVEMVDSVYACGDEEGRMEMRWLAAARVLSVRTSGDSTIGTALITTVARQTNRGYGWTARFGIREDTARWSMVRDTTTSRWMVCGDALDGYGLLPMGRNVRWMRGSRARALAAVDSIRRARRLPVVR